MRPGSRTAIGRSTGFTLIEVLVALAVISIAISGLAFVQITNLRATSAARLATDTKSAAGLVLERVLAQVLQTDTCAVGQPYCDEIGTWYAFNDYFWTCPDPVDPSAGSLAVRTDFSATISCGDEEGIVIVSGSGHDVNVVFDIAGLDGIEGEGVLAVTVTATHTLRDNYVVTVGDRITCYDVYPTPTAEAPAPCPVPTSGGSGR